VPGAPYKSTPFGAKIPSRSKMCEYFSGNSTISRTRATSRSSRQCLRRRPRERATALLALPQLGCQFASHDNGSPKEWAYDLEV